MGSPDAYWCAVQTNLSLSEARNPSQCSLLALSINIPYALLASLCSRCTGSSCSILLVFPVHQPAQLHTLCCQQQGPPLFLAWQHHHLQDAGVYYLCDCASQLPNFLTQHVNLT